MNLREGLIHFQNKAESDFLNDKNPSTLMKYILAFLIFILSTFFAGITMPVRLLSKTLRKKRINNPIRKMDKNNIESILKKEKLVLVDFWAEWCGPCLMMNPAVDEFAKNSPDVVVAKVNADTNNEIVSRFKVKGLPQFLLFKDGKEIKRHAGPMTTSDLKKFCSIEQ